MIKIICDSCKKLIKNVEEFYANGVYNDRDYTHLCIKCQEILERKFEKKFKELEEDYDDLATKFQKVQKKYKELKNIKKEEICNKIQIS